MSNRNNAAIRYREKHSIIATNYEKNVLRSIEPKLN
jgi:hypothetical protein